MDSRKFILKQTSIIAIGQAVCVGAMLGSFALLGQFDRSVLLGGTVGGDKAVEQNVKGGNAVVRLSYALRLILLAVVLFAFAKSGLCNIFALVLPLVFTRPILTITEFFRKPGDATK